MNPHEAKLVASFLRFAASRMGSDGCNDMNLRDTPENRALNKAAHEHEQANLPKGWAREDFEEPKSFTTRKGSLFPDATPRKGATRYFMTHNVTVCNYVRHCFEQEHGVTLGKEGRSQEGFEEGL